MSRLAAFIDTLGHQPSWPAISDLFESAETLKLRLQVCADLPFFDGHFAGHPVLPGVVQAHWAACLAQHWGGFIGLACDMRALKFHQLVKPDTALELHLHSSSQSTQGGQHSVQFRYNALVVGPQDIAPDSQAVSQGKLIFHS